MSKRKLTKGIRDQIRLAVEDAKASEWSDFMGELLDDLDAADETIEEYRLLNESLNASNTRLSKSVTQLENKNGRLRAALDSLKLAIYADGVYDGDNVRDALSAPEGDANEGTDA